MKERGVYRSTFVALTEDPDFLRLSSDARLLLWTLKHYPQGNVAGIQVVYLDALEALTGLPRSSIEGASKELEEGLWVGREGPVWWVRNQLRFEPTNTLADTNRRKGIINTLRSLPRYFIVRKFIEYYELGSTDERLPLSPSEGASKWLRGDLVSPPPDKEKEKEKEQEKEKSRARVSRGREADPIENDDGEPSEPRYEPVDEPIPPSDPAPVVRDGNRTLSVVSGYSPAFLAFADAYPKHYALAAAWPIWQQIRPPLDEVLAALEWQKTSGLWLEDGGRYVPTAQRYLSRRQWLDDPEAYRRETKKTSGRMSAADAIDAAFQGG